MPKLVPTVVSSLVAALLAPALAVGQPAPGPLPIPPSAEVAPVGPSPSEEAAIERARWSGKRLAVEILVGELAGGLLTYGAYEATDSVAAAWASGFALTPIVVWGTGRIMGGRGSLLHTYLGAGPALAPLAAPAPPDETPGESIERLELQMTIASIALPICNAIMFEVSSQIASTRWRQKYQPVVSVQPVGNGGELAGAVGSFAIQF
jgi:hypothetical protein